MQAIDLKNQDMSFEMISLTILPYISNIKLLSYPKPNPADSQNWVQTLCLDWLASESV